MSSKRMRIAGVAVLIAGVAALAGGVAHALLSANGSGSGFAATGSVGLTVNAPASHTCTYPSLASGELPSPAATPATCALAVTYTGSVSAYLSLTVQIQAKPGAGGTPLYDGSNATGLTLAISDGHTAFLVPTNPGTTGGTCPAGFTCWTAANELAAWYSGSTPSLAFGNGNTATWTVTPVFQRTAGNPYQGGQAVLTLTAQAVQGVPANALPSSCTTSTIGRPCPATGTFTWS